MAGSLYVDAPPAGRTRFTDWAREHADTLGRRYASELAPRMDRERGCGNEENGVTSHPEPSRAS
jgi:hypothetical protein